MMICAALLCVLSGSGCKENDIALYAEGPRIEFSSGSVYCSFGDRDYLNAHVLHNNAARAELIRLQLLGYELQEERSCCLKVGKGDRSDFDVDVSVPTDPITVPAGAFTAETFLTVACPDKTCVSTRNTAKTGSARVEFDLENPLHQFGAGRKEHMECDVSVVLQIYPEKWNSEQWGLYSTSKYIFMMETFQRTHDEIEATQENQVRIVSAYNRYLNDGHEPLKGDDQYSDDEIKFPLN